MINKIGLELNLIFKSKTMGLFFLLICCFPNIKIVSQQPSLENLWQFLFLLVISCCPPQQKMSGFYCYAFRALHICSNLPDLSNELNHLKSVGVSRG